MMKLQFRRKQNVQPNNEKKQRVIGILTLISLDYDAIYAEQFNANDYGMRRMTQIINSCDAMLRFGGRL